MEIVKDRPTVQSELQACLDNAKQLVDSGNVRGLVVVAVMNDGQATEASYTKFVTFYELVGILESVKARHLRPRK